MNGLNIEVEFRNHREMHWKDNFHSRYITCKVLALLTPGLR